VLDIAHRQVLAGLAAQGVSGAPRRPAQRRVRGVAGQVDPVAQGGQEAGEDFGVDVGRVAGVAGAQLSGVAAQRRHGHADRGDHPRRPVQAGPADQVPPHRVPRGIGAWVGEQPVAQRRQGEDTARQADVRVQRVEIECQRGGLARQYCERGVRGGQRQGGPMGGGHGHVTTPMSTRDVDGHRRHVTAARRPPITPHRAHSALTPQISPGFADSFPA
jgi:hypothetical protein